eukprot:XP_763788.1 hypothetical protein [Theileria parva strain Muguga]
MDILTIKSIKNGSLTRENVNKLIKFVQNVDNSEEDSDISSELPSLITSCILNTNSSNIKLIDKLIKNVRRSKKLVNSINDDFLTVILNTTHNDFITVNCDSSSNSPLTKLLLDLLNEKYENISFLKLIKFKSIEDEVVISEIVRKLKRNNNTVIQILNYIIKYLPLQTYEEILFLLLNYQFNDTTIHIIDQVSIRFFNSSNEENNVLNSNSNVVLLYKRILKRILSNNNSEKSSIMLSHIVYHPYYIDTDTQESDLTSLELNLKNSMSSYNDVIEEHLGVIEHNCNNTVFPKIQENFIKFTTKLYLISGNTKLLDLLIKLYTQLNINNTTIVNHIINIFFNPIKQVDVSYDKEYTINTPNLLSLYNNIQNKTKYKLLMVEVSYLMMRLGLEYQINVNISDFLNSQYHLLLLLHIYNNEILKVNHTFDRENILESFIHHFTHPNEEFTAHYNILLIYNELVNSKNSLVTGVLDTHLSALSYLDIVSLLYVMSTNNDLINKKLVYKLYEGVVKANDTELSLLFLFVLLRPYELSLGFLQLKLEFPNITNKDYNYIVKSLYMVVDPSYIKKFIKILYENDITVVFFDDELVQGYLEDLYKRFELTVQEDYPYICNVNFKDKIEDEDVDLSVLKNVTKQEIEQIKLNKLKIKLRLKLKLINKLLNIYSLIINNCDKVSFEPLFNQMLNYNKFPILQQFNKILYKHLFNHLFKNENKCRRDKVAVDELVQFIMSIYNPDVSVPDAVNLITMLYNEVKLDEVEYRNEKMIILSFLLNRVESKLTAEFLYDIILEMLKNKFYYRNYIFQYIIKYHEMVVLNNSDKRNSVVKISDLVELLENVVMDGNLIYLFHLYFVIGTESILDIVVKYIKDKGIQPEYLTSTNLPYIQVKLVTFLSLFDLVRLLSSKVEVEVDEIMKIYLCYKNNMKVFVLYFRKNYGILNEVNHLETLLYNIVLETDISVLKSDEVVAIISYLMDWNNFELIQLMTNKISNMVILQNLAKFVDSKERLGDNQLHITDIAKLILYQKCSDSRYGRLLEGVLEKLEHKGNKHLVSTVHNAILNVNKSHQKHWDDGPLNIPHETRVKFMDKFYSLSLNDGNYMSIFLLLLEDDCVNKYMNKLVDLIKPYDKDKEFLISTITNGLQMPENNSDLSTPGDEAENGLNLMCQIVLKYKNVINVSELVKVVYNDIKYLHICKFLIKQIDDKDELVMYLLTNVKNSENEILYYNLLISNHLVEEYDLKSYFHQILLIVNEYIINIDTKLNTLAKGIASNLINFLDVNSIFFNIRNQLYNTFTIPNNTNLVSLINSVTTSLDSNIDNRHNGTVGSELENNGDKKMSEEIDIYLINYILKKSLNMVGVKLKLTIICKYMVQDITDYSQLDKYYNFVLDLLFNLIYDNDQDIFNNILIIITTFSSKYQLFSERSDARGVSCNETHSSKSATKNLNTPIGRREFVDFSKTNEKKTEKLVSESVEKENVLISIYDKVMSVKTENMNDVCRKGNILLNLLMYMNKESKLNIYEDVLKRNELEVLVFILYTCYSVIDIDNLLYNLFTLFQHNKQVDTVKNIITSLIFISNNVGTDFVKTIVYHILYNFYFSKYPNSEQTNLFGSEQRYDVELDNLDDQADINDAKALMILELMNVMLTGNMRSHYPNVLLYNVEKKEFYPTPFENKVDDNSNGSVEEKERRHEVNKYVKYYLYIYNNAKVKISNELIDVMLDNIYHNTMRNKLVIVNFLVKNLKNNQSYTEYVLNDLLSTSLTQETNYNKVNSHYSIVEISNYIRNREYKLYDQIVEQLDVVDKEDSVVSDKDYSSVTSSFDNSELSFKNSSSKSFESTNSSEYTTNTIINNTTTVNSVDGIIMGKCMCLYKLMKNDLISRKLVEKVVYFLIFCLKHGNTVRFAMELLNYINFKYKTELSTSDNSVDKTVKLAGDENKLVINILNILLMKLKLDGADFINSQLEVSDVVNLQSSDPEAIIYNIVKNESGYFGYVFMKLLKLLNLNKSEEKTLNLLLKLCSLDRSSLLLENVDLLLLFLTFINKITDVGSIDSLDESDLVNRFLNSIHEKNMYKLVFILFQQILTTTNNTTNTVNGNSHISKSSLNGVSVNTTVYYMILYKLLNYEIILENFIQEYVQFILHTISSTHNSAFISFLLNKILNKIINVYKNNEITLIDIIYNHITQMDTNELSSDRTNGEVGESEVNADLIKVCLNYLNSDNDISIRGVNRAFSILLYLSNKGMNSFKHCVERVLGIMLRFIVTASVHSDTKNYIDTDRSFETGRTSVVGVDNSVNNYSEDSELNLTSVFSLMSKLLNLSVKYYDKLYKQILTVLLHQLQVNNQVNCTNIVINCIHKLTSQNREETINIINNIITRANINTFLLLFSLLHTIREDEIKMVNRDTLVNYLVDMNKYNLSEKVAKICNLLVKLNYITNEEHLNLKQQLI